MGCLPNYVQFDDSVIRSLDAKYDLNRMRQPHSRIPYNKY